MVRVCFARGSFALLCFARKPNRRCAKSQRQVIVYTHERSFLRSMTHCGSVMDSLPEVAFDHKAHRVVMSNNGVHSVHMAFIHVKLCLGMYILQSNKARFNQYFASDVSACFCLACRQDIGSFLFRTGCQ